MPKLKFKHRYRYDSDGGLDLTEELEVRFDRVRALANAVSVISLEESPGWTINELAGMIDLEVKDCKEIVAMMSRDQVVQEFPDRRKAED